MPAIPIFVNNVFSSFSVQQPNERPPAKLQVVQPSGRRASLPGHSTHELKAPPASGASPQAASVVAAQAVQLQVPTPEVSIRMNSDCKSSCGFVRRLPDGVEIEIYDYSGEFQSGDMSSFYKIDQQHVAALAAKHGVPAAQLEAKLSSDFRSVEDLVEYLKGLKVVPQEACLNFMT